MFFLSFSYTFFHEGKHEGIQQSLTYPTEEQRNKKAEHKHRKEKIKEHRTTHKEMAEP